MVPEIHARLASILGSLTDVILPAIDSGDAAAQEQAHLVVASLRLIQNQVDYSHAYEVADGRALVALVRNLAGLRGDAVPAEIAGFAQRFEYPLAFTNELRDANRRMRDIVAALVGQVADRPDSTLFDRIAQAILAYEDVQIRRDRAFVADTSFDVEPATLLPIPQSFDLVRTTTGVAK